MSDCGWMDRLRDNLLTTGDAQVLRANFSSEALARVIIEESDAAARSIRIQSEFGLTADQAQEECRAFFEVQELVA